MLIIKDTAIIMQLKKLAGFFFFTMFVIACVSCSQGQKAQEETTVTAESTDTLASTPSQSADKNKLTGNWVRSDAPYNLVINEVLENGNLKAAYLNPKSIHIARAEWAGANGVIEIYVELRDENYPGSNYRLTYYPDKDILTGKYFQAVEAVFYDIGFTRVK